MGAIITRNTSREQLAAIIVSAFEKHGMSAILVGGSVVSIYTHNKYESHDLDFVSPHEASRIDRVMKLLGFDRLGKDFNHPHTDFFVEFPASVLGIGNQIPVQPEGELIVGSTKIQLLSPSQCVMDRLAAWYHWNDTESLEQALMVSKDQPIDLKKIERWSDQEGEIEKFERFKARLKANF